MSAIYEIIEGKPVRMMEICNECGNAPQAPWWDQCFGCGKSNTERRNVPISECAETGITFASGARWTKWKAKA